MFFVIKQRKSRQVDNEKLKFISDFQKLSPSFPNRSILGVGTFEFLL